MSDKLETIAKQLNKALTELHDSSAILMARNTWQARVGVIEALKHARIAMLDYVYYTQEDCVQKAKNTKGNE